MPYNNSYTACKHHYKKVDLNLSVIVERMLQFDFEKHYRSFEMVSDYIKGKQVEDFILGGTMVGYAGQFVDVGEMIQ